MLEIDFSIHSNIRHILVRSNIDYSKIHFGTVRGVVYIRGLFRVARVHLRGEDADPDLKMRDFTAKTLYSFEKRVRSIPGVKDVIFQFLNWRKEGGQWVPVMIKKREKGDGAEQDSPIPSDLDRN
jgi:hypothetical protein